MNIVSIFLSLAQTMSGVLSIHMPGFLSAMNYLSPIRYAIRNLAPYSLRDIEFTCNASQMIPDGNGGMRCTVQNGIEALQLYSLDVNPWPQVLALGGCTIVYRALAYVILRVAKSHWEHKGLNRRFGIGGTENPTVNTGKGGVKGAPGVSEAVLEDST